MQVALVADPHLSLRDAPHSNIRLADTEAITGAIIDDLERRRPDLAIWMGDLTHEGTPEVRRRFRELAGRLTVPCLWMLGNHDVELVTKQRFSGEVVPCVARTERALAGWRAVVVDTVPELAPGEPLGRWEEEDLGRLSAAARSSDSPLLVLAHHPLREKYLPMEDFWRAVAGFRGAGVFIGAHSHRDLYSRERGWHLLDVRSCCREPTAYHLLELSPGGLAIRAVGVATRPSGPAPTDWAPDAPVFPLRIPSVEASLGDRGDRRLS
jgi:hypothetical protein